MSAHTEVTHVETRLERPLLAPWLQAQLESLIKQRGHAWILGGPSGLGQFELALATARAWLCEQIGRAHV